MKLANFFLMTVLVGTLGVLGCSDDTTNAAGSGGSGTAGTGGGGSGGEAGNGGTGGDPFDPELCNRDLCVDNDTLRSECETELALCAAVPDLQQDECIIVALATCDAE
jgi:hypothetical protein